MPRLNSRPHREWGLRLSPCVKSVVNLNRDFALVSVKHKRATLTRACHSARWRRKYKRLTAHGEGHNKRFLDTSSILVGSTKRVLDEHLLFQRRLRRQGFALIQRKRHLRWKSKVAFFVMLYLINLYKVGIAGMSRGISTGDNNTIFFWQSKFLWCDLLCCIQN